MTTSSTTPLSPTPLPPYYQWSPLSARTPLRWPNQARVALCIVVALESADWVGAEGAILPPLLAGRGAAYPKIPDVHLTSFREYGNRVGAFRMFDVLDQFPVKPTVAMDAEIATSYRPLVQTVLERGYGVIAHGLSGSQMISEQMGEAQERAYIEASLSAVAGAIGHTPTGWLGIEHGESSRTVGLLAEQGLRYVLDWPNDEQPYRMDVPTGSMISVPTLSEMSDVNAIQIRRWTMDRYADAILTGFDRLYDDGAEQGRLMVLELHPWVMGHAYRIPHLKRILEHCTSRSGVWAATTDEVVAWFESQS